MRRMISPAASSSVGHLSEPGAALTAASAARVHSKASRIVVFRISPPVSAMDAAISPTPAAPYFFFVASTLELRRAFDHQALYVRAKRRFISEHQEFSASCQKAALQNLQRITISCSISLET